MYVVLARTIKKRCFYTVFLAGDHQYTVISYGVCTVFLAENSLNIRSYA